MRCKELLAIGSLVAACSQGMILPAAAEEGSRPIPAWPLIYHREDRDQAETDILWPFFRYEREKTWSRYAIRPFLFSTERDPDQDYRKTSVLWPLTIYTHRGPEVSLQVLPLYWYGRFSTRRYTIVLPIYWDEEGEGYSHFHIWPLFGVMHRGESFTEYSTLYPLFRYGHDPLSGERDLHALWPIFNVHTKGEYLSHRFLPLYWYERGPDHWGGFIFPYYWRNTPTLTAHGIFPVWYSARGAEGNTDLVFPVYFNRETPTDHLRLIAPLYGRYERGDLGLEVGFPVYFRYRDGPSSFVSLFPFYYHSEDTEQRSAFTYYFPLYGTYRRGEAVSQHLFVFPLYSTLEDAELQLKAWDVLWPLFHYERSPTTVAVRVLGPAYMDTRYARTGRSRQDVLFPIFSRLQEGERGRTWLLPFYYHEQDPQSTLTLGSLALLPPYYFRREEPGGEELHVWPFYASQERGTYLEYATLWPLFRFGSDPQNDITMAHLLLFYRKTERERAVTTLFPLWWHQTTPQATFDASLGLHWYERDEGRGLTRASFFWIVPPDVSLITYEREPQRARHAVFPLYRYEHDERTDALRWSLLWPTFSYSSEGGVVRQTEFLWKVVSYERKDAETSDFRVLWRLVRSSRTKESSIFELNPFYYAESKNGETASWGILGGLLGAETTPDGQSKMRLLWIF